ILNGKTLVTGALTNAGSVTVDPGSTLTLGTAVYASSVIAKSSEYSPTSWSAEQATGAPNTFTYGDNATAWTPSNPTGAADITLGFAVPMYADGVTVRETYNNGFVTKIDVIYTDDTTDTVFSGTDPSLPGAPADF